MPQAADMASTLAPSGARVTSASCHWVTGVSPASALKVLQLACLVAEPDRAQADLLFAGQTDFAAKRICQQLVAQAQAHIGFGAAARPVCDDGFFLRQPGVFVFLPDVLRTAQHHQQVRPVERVSRRCFAELPVVDGDVEAALTQQGGVQSAGVFLHVAEDQCVFGHSGEGVELPRRAA
jgi:hypothetical protein